MTATASDADVAIGDETAVVPPPSPVFVLGGGDLGSGVVLALHRAGCRVIVIERPWPTALRLHVAFASAVLHGLWSVDGVFGRHVSDGRTLAEALARGEVAVWSGSEAELRALVAPAALVDARLLGVSQPDLTRERAPLVIALGPGHVAGVHCHAVIETNRGPHLGEVIYAGSAAPHTGIPGTVAGLDEARVVRSAVDGKVTRVCAIGDVVRAGDVVAFVNGTVAMSCIAGVVRGLKLDDVRVRRGQKIADVDPRGDRDLCWQPSDKSGKVGAGAVAALAGLAASVARSSGPGVSGGPITADARRAASVAGTDASPVCNVTGERLRRPQSGRA